MMIVLTPLFCTTEAMEGARAEVRQACETERVWHDLSGAQGRTTARYVQDLVGDLVEPLVLLLFAVGVGRVCTWQ